MRRRAAALVLGIALAAGANVVRAADPSAAGILFLIGDDWSAPHAGTYGEAHVRTPALDRLARGGLIFESAFAAAPVCAPSRAALLTGRPLPGLGSAAHQGGDFPDTLATFPELLLASGWSVACAGKGWGPGPLPDPSMNPAGPRVESFASFLEELPPERSFYFWHGSRAPHRPFRPGSGERSGHRPADAPLPRWLPDVPDVRSDVLDYVARVEELDHELLALLRVLDLRGRAGTTTVVVTSDNGMPFPRAKANVYDAGARVPLVMSPASAGAGRVHRDLVSLTDLAATLLEVAGIERPPRMTGSLAPLLRAEPRAHVRDAVEIARERHEYSRAHGAGYPVRAIRTRDHLYLRNLRPERGPAGDDPGPEGQAAFADVDPSPTKAWMLRNSSTDSLRDASFGKRPAEELYDVRVDPDQSKNLARDPRQTAVCDSLRARLAAWAAETGDPRAPEIIRMDVAPDRDPFEETPLPPARVRREEAP